MTRPETLITLFLAAAFVLFGGSLTVEADATQSVEAFDESEVLYVRRIEPLFREKCLGCHGNDPEDIQGGIDLKSWQSVIDGGDSGQPGAIAGNPEESSILLAAARGEDEFSAMPPKQSEALGETELLSLRRWIETGAKWPTAERVEAIEDYYADQWSVEDGVTVPTSGGLDPSWTNRRYDPAGLWAYQPVRAPRVDPAASPATNPIDHWINQAMPPGLSPAQRADRGTLIRRATFDLIGLPPFPAEVSEFTNDPLDDKAAFAALVDRLLQSPHHGERMAQHWLDVTRYADSSGFANDYERGNAWRYRDYVVRAFNDDKPYDEFIREQIAGDEINPNDPQSIIATGFLRMGPWELTGMEVAKVARMRFLDDVTNAVGETFLGQSLQCCRCHDHKFDPLPTRDYYSIQAVFATTQLAERKAKFLDAENTAGFDEKRYLISKRLGYKQTLAELEQVQLDNALLWYEQSGLDPAAWKDAVAAARENHPDRNAFDVARHAMQSQGVAQPQYPPKGVGFTPQEFGLERVARKGIERLGFELDRYAEFSLSVYNGATRNQRSVNSPMRMPEDVMKGEVEPSHIHTGGDPFTLGQPVQPGVLSVVADQVNADVPATVDGRRTALANWIADPNNPLTTRVIVNRVWQWHFGQAIAGNPNNFGSTGKRPTHPELLDWLAGELVEENWSIKNLHRRIMNSDAYCRTTKHPEPGKLRELDPAGQSHAAFTPRRLSAEELRDAMLAVGGELNPEVGGIPCRPLINEEVAFQPRQVMGTFASAWVPGATPELRNRRSIYVLKLRGLVDPSLEVFNSPSPDFSCERRDTSTVTPQVFAMFNSHNTHSRALALARDVMGDPKAARSVPDVIIDDLYRRVFGRSATREEISLAIEHWDSIESLLPADAASTPAPPREIVRTAIEENTGERFTFIETLHAADDFQTDVQPADVDRRTRALADVCLVLLNSNEFVYVY